MTRRFGRSGACTGADGNGSPRLNNIVGHDRMHRAVYARTAEEYCQYKVGSLSTYYPGDVRDCYRLVSEERICGSVCGACEPGWEFPEPGGTPP